MQRETGQAGTFQPVVECECRECGDIELGREWRVEEML